jgi:hypothetical protein
MTIGSVAGVGRMDVCLCIIRLSIFLSSDFPVRGRAGSLCLPACYEEHNAANERHRAHDGRQRNIVSLFASSVNRSDVDDLFPGRVCKPTPRETEQAKHYQNDAKRFAHGSPLRQRLHLTARKPARGRGLPVLRQDWSYLLIQYVFHLTELLLNFAA